MLEIESLTCNQMAEEEIEIPEYVIEIRWQKGDRHSKACNRNMRAILEAEGISELGFPLKI